jgi:hypothetical protein
MPVPWNQPMSYPMFEPRTPQHSSRRKRRRSPETEPEPGSSSPVRPDHKIPTISEFCEQYGLEEPIPARLKKMEFSLDYDVSSITQTCWALYEFNEISWGRVTKAYKKYRKASRS